MGLRLPWVSRYGAGSRIVVTRAAAYPSRMGVTPKCAAAMVTAERFASSMDA